MHRGQEQIESSGKASDGLAGMLRAVTCLVKLKRETRSANGREKRRGEKQERGGGKKRQERKRERKARRRRRYERMELTGQSTFKRWRDNRE